MNIEQKIEAILFWRGEPMTRKKLSEILEVGQNEINEGIEKLKENLVNRGIVLVEKPASTREDLSTRGGENELTLGTNTEISELIEKLQKEELNKELSKASLETLSILLYKNGTTRAEIDYIRGVNSSFILRALSVRGLVEKSVDTNDSRRFIYKPSLNLLSFMGIKSIEELPEFNDINKTIEESALALEQELKENEAGN